MHPYLQEHLARQRRDELLREAATTHLLNHIDHQSFLSRIKPLLLYLLAGSPRPSGKPSQQGYYEQAHSRAALRMTGLIALALGVLVGSLLDGRFGLAPAVLLDSAVLLMILVVVAVRSIGLVMARRL
jgi:hypothetical protein